MWVFTRQRTDQDKRMLINLSQHSVIQITQLGNKWFVDAAQGNDSLSLAQVDTQDEADSLVQQIFDSLHSGEKALDLNAKQEKDLPKTKEEAGNSHHAQPTAKQTG